MTPGPARFTVILPAGGSSSRFGRDKLLASLAGMPVIARTAGLFASREEIEQIIIATSRRDEIEPLLIPHLPAHTHGKLAFAPGGACRAESVRHALSMATSEWVAVHDAARPLVPPQCIDRVFTAALAEGAAALALPATLTIKQATGPLPARVIRTLPRHALFEMQTPQVTRRQTLLDAYARNTQPLETITDDMQLLELAGIPVMLVPGDARNIKLTNPADLHAAELLLA